MGGGEAAVKVLVTGGGGFLGRAIARRLLDRGDAVRSLTRSPQPELAAWGVEVHTGDVGDAEAVRRAVAGVDAVVHTAALAASWGPREAFERTNVAGTRHVVEACRAEGVRRLVHTSTPSVVHAGGSIEGGDESLPIAERFDAAYPETKARAERIVREANGPELATVALRPHLVWGPGDTNLVPRILERARAGRLFLVGGGRHLVDTTYIDNAADAHLAALDRLGPGAACAGRAYFVSNGEPVPQAEIIGGILEAAGLPPERPSMPLGVAVAAGALFELLWTVLRRDDEPPMTRFVARQLGTAHHFDISAARRDLGWEPRVSLAEGLARLRAALRGEA